MHGGGEGAEPVQSGSIPGRGRLEAPARLRGAGARLDALDWRRAVEWYGRLRCRLRPEGVRGQGSTPWAWASLSMVPILTVLKFVRDARLAPSVGQGSRKEVPMRQKAHRSWLLCAVLETLWAIGASYAAGCLPT